MEDNTGLDKILDKIANDGIIMSPETIKLKNMELHREYCKFEEEMITSNKIDTEGLNQCEILECQLSIYKSWVGHKLAVYDLSLGKILDFLNEDNED